MGLKKNEAYTVNNERVLRLVSSRNAEIEAFPEIEAFLAERIAEIEALQEQYRKYEELRKFKLSNKQIGQIMGVSKIIVFKVLTHSPDRIAYKTEILERDRRILQLYLSGMDCLGIVEHVETTVGIVENIIRHYEKVQLDQGTQ